MLTRQFGLLATRLLMAAALLPLVQATALAEPQDGQVFQDWAIRCQKDPNNAAIELCSMAHAAINKENQRPVMQIELALVGEQAEPVAVITVPLLVRLPPGVRLQVDDGQAMSIPYELCNPEGCKARFRVDEATMSAFRKGSGGKVAVQVPPTREIEIPFSLKGFSAALAALK